MDLLVRRPIIKSQMQELPMSKRFGPLAFKGSTEEKSPFQIFRFSSEKPINDKKENLNIDTYRLVCILIIE